jgi:hypothetical protein
LKEDALDLTMWRARFGRGFGPVVRQTTKWMNPYRENYVYRKLPCVWIMTGLLFFFGNWNTNLKSIVLRLSGRQDFSMRVVTGLRTGRPRNRCRSPCRGDFVSFLKIFIQTLEANQTSNHWAKGALFLGITRPKLNAWSRTSTSNIFLKCCWIEQRDNCSF